MAAKVRIGSIPAAHSRSRERPLSARFNLLVVILQLGAVAPHRTIANDITK
jgi:hypothetical protein